MLNTIIIGAVGGLIFSLIMKLVVFVRYSESDKYGNATMRYLVPPYATTVVGCVSLAVGIYQWFEPLNHHYSGNLLILSYTPITIALFCYLFAIHLFSFKITLKNGEITLTRWPLNDATYKLSECVNIEQDQNKFVLEFNHNRKLTIYPLLSGHKRFIEIVSAAV